MTLRTYHKIILIEMQKRSLFKVTIFNMGLDREFAYWSHKYAHISETVHLRHFMTPDEYHHHCIAFDLGYLYLTLSDLRRSNQGQIGKNHSKWLITLVLHFRIKICLPIMSVRTPKTLLKNTKFVCGLCFIYEFFH